MARPEWQVKSSPMSRPCRSCAKLGACREWQYGEYLCVYLCPDCEPRPSAIETAAREFVAGEGTEWGSYAPAEGSDSYGRLREAVDKEVQGG